MIEVQAEDSSLQDQRDELGKYFDQLDEQLRKSTRWANQHVSNIRRMLQERPL